MAFLLRHSLATTAAAEAHYSPRESQMAALQGLFSPTSCSCPVATHFHRLRTASLWQAHPSDCHLIRHHRQPLSPLLRIPRPLRSRLPLCSGPSLDGLPAFFLTRPSPMPVLRRRSQTGLCAGWPISVHCSFISHPVQLLCQITLSLASCAQL
ncbi:hypothetical protein HYPSUDRAFT_88335 [Hypholoma sublateritium FD-334 SS-4]|uniref:Uncharacterized protein n=1 Tax=Hypholoma sublateritium (strain FD-334 SS-4) TaxID=945553 RepID=A0A0D2L302_HYPSF|nr:hypothetical protein HYPSUDRAFT_88335 [Hypholoma sublateritium FD-334 SS-4]